MRKEAGLNLEFKNQTILNEFDQQEILLNI